MDWSRIKTIFILTFLILDIYLVYEYSQLRMNGSQALPQDKLENSFKSANIKFEADIPKGEVRDGNLTAVSKNFAEENLEELKETILKDQDISTLEENALNSTLNKPFKVGKDFNQAELDKFVRQNIYEGDKYGFWEKSDDSNKITYYQKFEGKFLYKNVNGELTFYLNADQEIVTYRQTLFEKVQYLKGDKKKLIDPTEAIENLYRNQSLKEGSKITDVEQGYYSNIQDDSSTWVLSPAWRVVVDGKENLFVNAFKGQVLSLDSEKKDLGEDSEEKTEIVE
ncbi:MULTISPECIES: two-component system regulatory protein YycI [Bacillaceae]|uniref:Regulatory protein YycH-like domain-containing protein n=1 Tax=Bacillus infantis TaxID=324767 RepID=A0A5D4SR88_9BACI|nr:MULTISPECIES: two-component system regulatory protein YycI [Bacillus]MCA1033043.1 two-component system regulatory protein YycI [Bacillus infantis]MCP1161162.1 two-component system regulatory protein YycI [Bacillus infantis]MDT0161145.1 two-component system regulatory protein YycI [Bacillus sp. AG4(2022)]MDW2879884.1 two-component system regulatory protein YycI [Bacillus infantis]PLR73097.1 hypothetical protein CYJ37_05930 [Bacillus sp. UMB0728]